MSDQQSNQETNQGAESSIAELKNEGNFRTLFYHNFLHESSALFLLLK